MRFAILVMVTPCVVGLIAMEQELVSVVGGEGFVG